MIGKIEQAIEACQPAVYLRTSSNPVDAIGMIRYRDAEYGHACVFLSDGRYGDLWWTVVTENKQKAHVEWNFSERGHYKW